MSRAAYSPPDLSPQGRLRTSAFLTQRSQDAAYRAELVNALLQQRAQLMQKGVDESHLPRIAHDMSPRDLVETQKRLTSMGSVPGTVGKLDPSGRLTTEATGAGSRTGQSLPVAAGQIIPGATVSPAGDTPVKPAKVIKTAENVPQPFAAAGGRSANLIPTSYSAGLPEDQPAAPPVSAKPTLANPTGETGDMGAAMKALPFANGNKLPADAQVTTGGAGTSVLMEGQSGPVSVGVQPTMEQVMHARTGGAWQKMTPAQRGNWLRANATPFNRGAGTVLSTGEGQANFRGISNVESVGAGGIGQQYDPTKDQGIITAPTAPGADRSVYIDPKYVTPGASAIGSATYGGGAPAAPAAPAAPLPFAKNTVPEAATASPMSVPGYYDPAPVVPEAATASPMSVPGYTGAPATDLPYSTPMTPLPGAATDSPMSVPGYYPETYQDKVNSEIAKLKANKAASDQQLKGTAAAIDAQQAGIPVSTPFKPKMSPTPGMDVSETPLGSTSMKEDPLIPFSENPEDAEYKKRLTTTASNMPGR